jgi:hypothetical protein
MLLSSISKWYIVKRSKISLVVIKIRYNFNMINEMKRFLFIYNGNYDFAFIEGERVLVIIKLSLIPKG